MTPKKTKTPKKTAKKTLQVQIAIGSADLAKAQAEVTLLLNELNAGTLNNTTLKTGLLNLQQYVGDLTAHIHTFSN